MTQISVLRAALAVTLLALAGTAPIASAQTDRERDCRQNAMPACTQLGEVIMFSLRSGRNNASVGSPDPIWRVNGAPANTVVHPSWQPNGGATWISPATTGTDSVAAGEHTYTAQVWFDNDPYLYDFVRMNLTIGADNTVVSVTVNGTVVHTGNGGEEDFRTVNFDQVRHRDTANWPWVRGCNQVVITIHNTGSPSGVSILGNVRARCSRCMTPRPPAGTPEPAAVAD